MTRHRNNARPGAVGRPMIPASHRPIGLAAPLAVLWLLAALLAACAGAGATTTLPPTPTAVPVTTPDEAVAAVIAHEPRLAGIRPLDPNLIGQASWYEVAPASGVGAFIVKVRVGWGDCPAGCINQHTWTYAVLPDGTVNLQSEAGDEVPPEAWPSPAGAVPTGLRIAATAGPTCPVAKDPPDPACAPRPVAGAEIRIQDAQGRPMGMVVTGADGTTFLALAAGSYTVQPQPVQGLMGTAAPVSVTVTDGAATQVTLDYDTGIR